MLNQLHEPLNYRCINAPLRFTAH